MTSFILSLLISGVFITAIIYGFYLLMRHSFQKHSDVNTQSTVRITLILAISIGALTLFLGFALCVLGLTGNIEILIEAKGIQARIINGTPGAVFSILGFLIIWRFKPKKSIHVTEERTVRYIDINTNQEKKVVTHTKTVHGDSAMITKKN